MNSITFTIILKYLIFIYSKDYYAFLEDEEEGGKGVVNRARK